VRTVKKVGWLVVLAALGAGPLLMAQMGYSQRAKEIGTHLKCMCRGCDMSAGLCAHPGGSFSGPCDTAKSQLKEIDEHLANGESEQQIIDAFVAKYGTVVYMEPPKKGFGLVAWLMPVFYSVVGLGVLVFVVRKWAVRPGSHEGATPTAVVHDETLERARAQAARDTEEL
jgi:cytochrome c-type biogenesis protein CcmH/NrfF